jgi:hypothetical protein
MPVENGRRFKFKSAVWGPTLVEGLSKQDVHMNLIMENVHDFYERKKYMKLAVN